MARGKTRSLVPLLLTAAVALAIGGAAWLAFRGSKSTEPRAAATPGEVVAAEAPRDEGVAESPPAASDAIAPAVEVPERSVETAPMPKQRAEVVESADAELADAIWVEGIVRFPEGTPLDETVEVIADGKKFEHRDDHRATVGADGRFRVAFAMKTKTGWLRLDAPRLYLAEPLKLDLASIPTEIALAPQLGGRITGAIVPPEDVADVPESVRKAQVQVNGRGRGEEYVHRTSALDASLRFDLRGLPPQCEYHLSFDAADWTEVSKRDVRVGAGETIELELACTLGARVSGRVVDASDAPLAGVAIRAEVKREVDGHSDIAQRSVSARDDGSLDLRGIAPGEVRVVATKDGYVDARLDLGSLADGDVREGVEIRMDSGNFVAGRVTWPDGVPAAGAYVKVEQTRPEGEDRWIIVVDRGQGRKVEDDGSFRVSGLHDGPCTVTAQAREGMRPATGPDGKPVKPRAKGPTWNATAKDVAPGRADVVLVLEAGLAISGRVVDDTGAPVTKFSVYANERPDSHFASSGGPGGVSNRFEASDGRFELQGLKPGTWVVMARAFGFEENEPVVASLPGDGAPLTLVLNRCATLSGVVVDTAGDPVAKAKVSTVAARGGANRYSHVSDEGSAVTDERGVFTIDRAPSGTVSVTASHASFAASPRVELAVAAGARVDGVRLVLGRGGSIRGEIHASVGRALGGWSISLWSQDADHYEDATSDATGRFAFERVTPGTYSLSASEPRLARASNDEAETVTLGTMLFSTVTVVEGETATVILGAPPTNPVRVSGFVRRGGKPLADRQVWAFSAGRNFTAASGADGRYELTLDGPGEYTFVVFRLGGDAGTQFTRHVEIPAVASFALDFDLPSSRIAGRVVGPDGAPVESAQVTLRVDPSVAELSSTGVHGSAGTGEDGAFEFENLAPGVYQIDVTDRMFSGSGARFGSVTRRDLRIEAGGALEGVEIRVVEAAVIEGIVRTESGTPAVGAYVLVCDEHGAIRREWASTDGAGRYRLDGLTQGVWTVCARTESEASNASAPVRLSAGSRATIDLDLRPGTILRVIVEDVDGREVGAALSVRGSRGIEYARPSMQSVRGSGERSWRTFGPLAPGAYDVTATNHDGVSASARVSLHGEAEKEIRLRLGGQ